ncbi:hypothetical protein HWV62_16488 [Athelia sp. TMB]|nr:hypothetical protein HWV62_16488 [Athelia sp. TMB]
MISKGLIVPNLPLWAYNNDYNLWWSLNDFEIHATRWRKDTEDFVIGIATYLPDGKSALSKDRTSSERTTAVQALHTSSFAPPMLEDPFYGPSISTRHEHNPAARFLSAPPQQFSHQGSSAFLGTLMSGGNNTSNTYRPQQPHNQIPFSYLGGQQPQQTPVPRGFQREAPGAPDDDPNGSDSEDSRRGPGRIPRTPAPPRSSRRPAAPTTPAPSSGAVKSYHFDLKLKLENIPQWDGDEDKLARWIDKVNSIAKKSVEVHRDLGSIVPRRFTAAAETWYYSIPPDHREYMEESWSTLRAAIGNYWMNHQWLERQKIRANTTRFRDSGNSRETPSEYVVRKLDLVRLVYNFTDTECIQMIMNEAPSSWSPIIQPHTCRNIVEFINAVKYHENHLADASFHYGSLKRDPYQADIDELAEDKKEGTDNPAQTVSSA